MDDSVGRFDLWKRRRQKKRKFSKKKKKKKNIIATKIHHLLVRTSRKEVRERALSLSSCLSLERVARFLFLGFSTRGNASFFPRFFFRARDHTHRTRERVGRLPAKKNKKKTRKIIAPTGTRATRLADSTRAKRAERMRSNPFFLSFGFETVSMYGWVPASVEASSS